MSTSQFITASRNAGPIVAAVLLVVLSAGELSTLVLPIPAPVVIVSLLLVPPGVAAAIGLWQRSRWGLPLAWVVALVSTAKAALGVALATPVIARGMSGVAMALGLLCCAFLIRRADRAAE